MLNQAALATVFIGNLIVTSYRSVPGQTDSTPYYTSTGEKVSLSGAAISQDLLCKACRKLHRRCKCPDNPTHLHYGDCLYIDGVGFRIINDCMGTRKHWKIKTKKGYKVVFKKQLGWVDVWVNDYSEEHKFHTQNGIKLHKIWLIKENHATH